MEGTCITIQRTKKPEGTRDWSWRERKCNGCDIFPGILDQGPRGVCLFCAFTSVGQMSLNAAVAKKTQKKCRIRLQWESLLRRFLELHGLRPPHIDGDEVKMKMEKELIDKRGRVFDLNDGACWGFKNLGIEATFEEDNGEKTSLNVGLHDYTRYNMLTEDVVKGYIEECRAIKTSILIGEDFDDLQEDEIYAWCPKVDKENETWVENEEPGRHAIVLIGNGDPHPKLDNLQHHPFQNSHGEEFAKRGVGSVFYKSLLGPMYLLEMEAEPKTVTATLPELSNIPLPIWHAGTPRPLTPPPPRHRPTLQRPRPPCYIPPPARDGWSSPARPRVHMNRDQWKNPISPRRDGYYPPPARGRWPSPPVPRDNMNRERWKN